jgi:hypothetical protein
MTKPQLATGPQKWVVLGPTGLFRNDLSAVAMGEGEAAEIPAHVKHTESPHQIKSNNNNREIEGRRSRQDVWPGVAFREKIHQPVEGERDT